MRITSRWIAYVFAVLILLQTAHALGVSPSRINLDFTADLQQEVSFSILNNENKDIDVHLYPRGELASYVLLENNILHIPANQEAKVRYKLNVPYSARKPGQNLIEIVIEELPPNYEQGTVIQGKLAVVHQLVLKSPYEGSFADAIFTANNPEFNQDLQFAVDLSNVGDQDIDSFRAELQVFNSDFELIATRKYSFDGLLAQDHRKETLTFDQQLMPGNYFATTKIFYGGKVIDKETTFSIGKPYAEIESIGSSNFALGSINKVDIAVYNAWHDTLKDVSGEVTVKDKSGKVYSIFKTITVDILPFTGNSLLGYWDTSQITAGNYIFSVQVTFNGKTAQKDFEIQVQGDQFKAKDLSLSGNVVAGKNSLLGNSTVSILIVAFIILMIVNVVLILYLRRGKRPPQQLQNLEMQAAILLFSIGLALFNIFFSS